MHNCSKEWKRKLNLKEWETEIVYLSLKDWFVFYLILLICCDRKKSEIVDDLNVNNWFIWKRKEKNWYFVLKWK
jgi:hypothetical protein